MKFISTLLVLTLGLVVLTSFAMTFKGSSIHQSDVFFICLLAIFTVIIIIKAFKFIRDSFTASIAISMLVTVLGILFVFSPSSPEGSLFTTVWIIFATWMMTITKILPTIVSLVISGILALINRNKP